MLTEGCHTVTASGGVVRIGGFPLMPGERPHGLPGTVGLGLQARRHALDEGALALAMVTSVVERQLLHDMEGITVEVIDQSDRQEIDHETW